MDKKRLAELLEEKKPAQDCSHQWERMGYWDGENIKTHQPINGPIAKCSKCGGVSRPTWKEWKALLKKMETHEKTVDFDGPCPFLLCLEKGPHSHPICPKCGTIDYKNIYGKTSCDFCKKKRRELREIGILR